jgi:hypothetical protein
MGQRHRRRSAIGRQGRAQEHSAVERDNAGTRLSCRTLSPTPLLLLQGWQPYRVNVTTGVSERYGAVLFPRKS